METPRHICELLTEYANANPLDADRAWFAIERLRKENRGREFNLPIYGLFGQTEEEFISDILDTMNNAEPDEEEEDESAF